MDSRSWRKERRAGHVTGSGKPKRSYGSEEIAADVATRMAQQLYITFDHYQCPTCELWHVGKPPRHGRDFYKPLGEALETELGDRAAGCLVRESSGKPGSRRRVIADRVLAAMRRRGDLYRIRRSGQVRYISPPPLDKSKRYLP